MKPGFDWSTQRLAPHMRRKKHLPTSVLARQALVQKNVQAGKRTFGRRVVCACPLFLVAVLQLALSQFQSQAGLLPSGGYPFVARTCTCLWRLP